jgi:hypothetical protein
MAWVEWGLENCSLTKPPEHLKICGWRTAIWRTPLLVNYLYYCCLVVSCSYYKNCTLTYMWQKTAAVLENNDWHLDGRFLDTKCSQGFHYVIYYLDSGPQWWTHVLSPVTAVEKEIHPEDSSLLKCYTILTGKQFQCIHTVSNNLAVNTV